MKLATNKCNWPGKSGKTYSFDIYQMAGNWNPVPGVYIFAKRSSPTQWTALYVGEAGSFKTRLTPSHEEWPKAIKLGATHVHALAVVELESVRKTAEKDLIQQLNPPLNQKYRLRRAG